jgi:hypothetical protein
VPGTGGTMGRISSVLDLVQKVADQRFGHGLMDIFDAHQPARIGDDRMAAVQDADLHHLEGMDLIREGDAHLFQRRAAIGEIVLDHPLPEGLAGHGHRIVAQTEAGGHGAFARAGRGGDAVHHAVRERRHSPRSSRPVPGPTAAPCPITASWVTWPLPGRLSQDMTVKGGMPAARRAFSAATMAPKAVRVAGIGAVGNDLGRGRGRTCRWRGSRNSRPRSRSG